MKTRLLLLSILLISSPHLAAGMFDQLIQEGVNAVGKGIKKASGVTDDGKAVDGKTAGNLVEDINKTDLEKGYDAYDARDYKTAMRLLKPLAEQGGQEAQRLVGSMYQMKGDLKTAVKWHTLSAEQGTRSWDEGTSQYNLWIHYLKGDGVPKDNKTALKWLLLSADNVNHGALERMGDVSGGIYDHEGQFDIVKNDSNAIMWFKLAQGAAILQKTTMNETNMEIISGRMTKVQITKGETLYNECLKIMKLGWKDGKRTSSISKECGMDSTQAAQFAKQSVGLEKALDLKKFYEAYFLVRACNDLDTKYISNSQLKKTKKAIRSLDDQAKKQGVDTDKVYKDAETNPSESTNNSLAAVKTIKLLGGAKFNRQLRTTCMGQSNILILLAEGDKAKKAKGKKDF